MEWHKQLYKCDIKIMLIVHIFFLFDLWSFLPLLNSTSLMLQVMITLRKKVQLENQTTNNGKFICFTAENVEQHWPTS